MNHTSTSPNVSTIVNGVDVSALGETVAAIAKQPVLGATTFRSTSDWQDDRQVVTTIDDFAGGGAEHRRPSAHELITDLPEALMGTDRGPSPLELAVSALGSCIATTLVAHASSREIRLDGLRVNVSGPVDLRGMLNLADVRPGYAGLELEVDVSADMPEADLDQFVHETLPRSPVLDLFLNGVPVTTRVEARRPA